MVVENDDIHKEKLGEDFNDTYLLKFDYRLFSTIKSIVLIAWIANLFKIMDFLMFWGLMHLFKQVHLFLHSIMFSMEHLLGEQVHSEVGKHTHFPAEAFHKNS